MNPTIQLRSGAYFNFLKPETTPIAITDIAWGLSRLCRFTGHCGDGGEDLIYSVAQHSIYVSNIVPRQFALQGLLHDAAEAVLGDVSKPLKMLLPDYQVIEHRVEQAIFAQFGLPAKLDPCVKLADNVMLKTERRDLMPAPDGAPEDAEWAWLDEFEALPNKIEPIGGAQIRVMFIRQYRRLCGVPR